MGYQGRFESMGVRRWRNVSGVCAIKYGKGRVGRRVGKRER